MSISPASVASLYLTPKANGQALGTATGFVFSHEERSYLITNWHVATGRHRITGQPIHRSGATPDTVDVRHRFPAEGHFAWADFPEPLLGPDEQPLWLEHPRFGRRVDVVALPLTNTVDTILMPYGASNLILTLSTGISDWVNIVGFPFGIAGGGSLAVWTKGGIATEMEINYDNLPCFLIDSRTRPGQSGSPVIAYSGGGTIKSAQGAMIASAGPITDLLGVYSGRINSESDLGHVWKAAAVLEIVTQGVPGSNSLRSST